MKTREIITESEIPVDEIFFSPAVPWPSNYVETEPEEITVLAADLVPTQKTLDVSGVRDYLFGRGSWQDHLPEVVKRNDEYLILDGHHRVAAQIKQGRSEIEVLLVGFDE